MNPQEPRHVRRDGSRPSFGSSPSASGQRRASRRAGGGGGRTTKWRPTLPKWRPGLQSWRQLLAVLVGVALLIGFFHITTISTIKVTGSRALSSAKVQQYTQNALDRQLVGGSLPLVNTGGVAGYLRDADPTIKQATVTRVWPNTLLVTITERKPSLNWKSGGVSYVLDSDGTVIGSTPPDYAALPTIVDNTNLPVKEGSRVVDSSFVLFTTGMLTRLQTAGIQVSGLSVPETTTELYMRTNKGYTIKFDTTRSVEDEYNDLVKVQGQLKTLNKTPAEYIDLRIPGKAYYR